MQRNSTTAYHPLTSNSRAYKLLHRMYNPKYAKPRVAPWAPGQGLGRKEDGRLNPVSTGTHVEDSRDDYNSNDYIQWPGPKDSGSGASGGKASGGGRRRYADGWMEG